jgi:phosphate-selective porin OprO/OprP
MDGWFYEVCDFFFEFDFINTFTDPGAPAIPANVWNTPVPTDLWVSINHLPIIGVFRAGNMKPPIGFEHLTSSRYLNFIERSLGFDAFIEEGNNGVSPGFQILNWTENERLTWQMGAFKTTRSIMGWNVGDGEWGYVGRLTWLPWYEDHGRYMMHLGLGGAYKDLDDGIFRARARWELRNGPASTHNIVAIAQVDGNNQQLVNPEFYLNYGPFSMQAEYQGNWIQDVTRIIRTPTQTGVPLSSRTFFGQAAYVEALYFLTGENRQYGKTGSHSSGTATGRVIPNRNFFWVPGHGCPNPFSAGAWQAGLRYSYLDLNNNGINGGQVNDVTAGLNWYLNPNFKIQWNYSWAHRTVPDGTSSGALQGFGMRFALDW